MLSPQEADDPPKLTAATDLLLGDDKKADQALREELTPKYHVTSRTTPLFIWHTIEDTTVPYTHSLSMFEAAKAAKRDAELLLYSAEGSAGRHAQGLGLDNPKISGWSKQFLAWLGPDWVV